MLFVEYDRSNPIKNFTGRDRLNLRELQVYMILSAKFTVECTKNYASQVNQVLNRCFFTVFSENWEGNQKFFICQSHMCSAVFFAIIRYI